MPVTMQARRRFYISGQRKEVLPGDKFSVPTQDDADRLVRRMKAEVVGKPNPTDLPTDAGISAIRKRYEEVAGKRPFHGWSEQTLLEKIGTYRTTHMTAQK
jgi:hypothetical protein